MEEEKKDKVAPVKEPEVPQKKLVTADVSVDFPSLGWAINAGDTRELPVDEQAQETILSNHHIKLIN